MSTTPDTTVAVRQGIALAIGTDTDLADAAIAADRQALKEQGYVIVPVDFGAIVEDLAAYDSPWDEAGCQLCGYEQCDEGCPRERARRAIALLRATAEAMEE